MTTNTPELTLPRTVTGKSAFRWPTKNVSPWEHAAAIKQAAVKTVAQQKRCLLKSRSNDDGATHQQPVVIWKLAE